MCPDYPPYSRYDKKFEKNLAAIDALFNTGALPIYFDLTK